jgi:hypothetical protein
LTALPIGVHEPGADVESNAFAAKNGLITAVASASKSFNKCWLRWINVT